MREFFRKIRPKLTWPNILGLVLFLSLLFSLGYAIYRAVITPQNHSEALQYGRLREDYILMVAQCILALGIMFLPSLLDRRFSLAIPSYMFVLYYLFLYCAVYLGEVRKFYFIVPHWDTMLHGFSSITLGALGFALVSLFNDAKRVDMHLSPGFVALFAFCFSLAAGAVWEIYEYTLDGLLTLNMQKFMLEEGTQLIGRAALADTMKDILVDAFGALAVSLVGYFMLKRGMKLTWRSEKKPSQP